jgi:parallel beta-helix repeat protein
VGKKFVYSILAISLVAVLVVTVNVRNVEASGTIYIRADGLVFPSDAPIIRDGDVYTLTDNINDSIVVQRDYVVIDGAETYALEGPGDYDSVGIDLSERHNVTIRNFREITLFGYGILLNLSSSVVVSGNILTANNRGGIFLSEATNNVVYGNNLTMNMNYDVRLYQSSNNEISGNCLRRILLEYGSNNNSVVGNEIAVSGQEGVGLGWSANNNTVSDNLIRGGLYGVHVFYASGQKILRNNISNTQYGLHLADSSNNIISVNSVSNVTTAIYLDSSSENTIFHNNFIDYDNDAFVYDANINLWDYGYPDGGNYWSNYSGVDLNLDSVGDSSHILDLENRDNYPLMGSFTSYNTSTGECVYVISNSTIKDFTYWAGNNTIRMYVANATSDQTFGFCRLCIPHGLINEPFNVTVNGVSPVYWNYTLHENGTHSWIYFSYEHSTVEIVIIPEFPSLIAFSLLIMSTLVVGVTSKKASSKKQLF